MGILGDIIKRDLTGEPRREDNINNLNLYDLKDYIDDNYIMLTSSTAHINDKNDIIYVPLIDYIVKAYTNMHDAVFFNYFMGNDICLPLYIFNFVPELKNDLKKMFITTEDKIYVHFYKSDKKDIDTKYFISILDYMIDFLGDKACIKRK